jgi:hypothetical protein
VRSLSDPSIVDSMRVAEFLIVLSMVLGGCDERAGSGANAATTVPPATTAPASPASSATPGSTAPRPSPLQFSWTPSLPITSEAPAIGVYGGTELRAITALHGKLYAANGYWQDSEMDRAALPGPQIYRLDGPGGRWQVEYELPKITTGRRRVREYQALTNLTRVSFSKDRDGHALAPPADLLVAGVFSRGSGVDVFLRSPSGRWSDDPISPQSYLPSGAQIRAFAVHTDAVTGAEMAFAGGADVVFSGMYSAQTQTIDWNPSPDWLGPKPGKNNIDSNGGRITSFAECHGRLYAAGDAIYEREDGSPPSWRPVFTLPRREAGGNERGFSGLTCSKGPSEEPALFSSFQGAASDIVRVDLGASGPKGTVDLDAATFLSGVLRTVVTTAIVGYNDMTVYPTTDPACPSLLMGFSVHTPSEPVTFGTTHKSTRAGFLVRDCKGRYTTQWVNDPAVQPVPRLVGVRAISLSPFAEELPGTIYVGGFDAGNAPEPGVHNTAWLYRGAPSR